jgi:hypothetical protein
MSRQTIPKSFRLTPSDIERIGALLHEYPEARSESGLMGKALEIGLLTLTAGAVRPGLPGRHGGYAEDDLAASSASGCCRRSSFWERVGRSQVLSVRCLRRFTALWLSALVRRTLLQTNRCSTYRRPTRLLHSAPILWMTECMETRHRGCALFCQHGSGRRLLQGA